MQNAQLVQRHAADLRRSEVGNATLHGMCPRAACSASRCGAPKPAFGGAQIAHPRLVLPGSMLARPRFGLGGRLVGFGGSAPPPALSSPSGIACALSSTKEAGANRDASLCVLAPTLTGPPCCLCGGRCRPPRTAPEWRACANAQGRPGRQFGAAEVDTPDTAVLHGAGVAGNLVQILICRSQTVSKYYSVRACSAAARRRAMPAMK